jgi:hypothetical protein
VIRAHPKFGKGGSTVAAPGSPAAKCAVANTSSIHHPMAGRAICSIPNSIRKNATISYGITQSAVAVTAIKFANNPKYANLLK